MAKKFGKFLLFTAVASAAAAGAYYYLKEKDAPIPLNDEDDEDFDAFGDDQEEDSNDDQEEDSSDDSDSSKQDDQQEDQTSENGRTYVTITPEKPTESVAETVKKVFQDAKDTIVSKVVSMKPLEEEKIEEFFDDEVHEGMIPVCIEEFYNNEYQEIK